MGEAGWARDMVKEYIPEQGDIVWVSLPSAMGHEQRGRRPAIVLSQKIYNEYSRLALMCPITSKEKGYPFEVRVNVKKVNGVALADQVQSLDYKARRARFIAVSGQDILSEIN